MLAAGLVALDKATEPGRTLRVPYPAQLQRAFDRLSLMCLTAGTAPPESVVELFDWCARPFQEWPHRLRADGAEDWIRLLYDGRPTPECVEWYVAGDVEAEFREQSLIFEAMDICREHDRADVYTAFRELLVTKPVLTDLELAMEQSRPDLTLVAHLLQRAYRDPQPEAVRQGEVLVCASCGCLLLPEGKGNLRCTQTDCTKRTTVGRRLAVDDGVRALGRDMLIWVCAPGRAEIRIRDRIASKGQGLSVEMWPDFDASDLEITFEDQSVWAADVKTWANPAELAKRLHRRPFRAPDHAAQAFVVVGKHQLAARPNYMDSLVNHNPALGRGPVRAITERMFIEKVIRRAGGH
ncbi:hypothetical protein ACIBG8_45215 [Nonomuraea sp. NPDC050556]|uniref:pPIWI_RE_Y domain-containing protein n=1 Tax=Nonomuraea sp. NPDC050556 TaxID=3364369 RepID=UPI0037A7C298